MISAGKNGLTLIEENDQLTWPCGICIDDNDQWIYIADRGNQRIVRWKFNNETKVQIVAGENGEGNQMNQLY